MKERGATSASEGWYRAGIRSRSVFTRVATLIIKGALLTTTGNAPYAQMSMKISSQSSASEESDELSTMENSLGEKTQKTMTPLTTGSLKLWPHLPRKPWSWKVSIRLPS